jgi:two-component system OmpR family response regulator
MRLLVVEDEMRMAALLQRGLVEEGYTVDVTTTGTAGLAAALEVPYDAVVLDVMVPGIDGFEVCRRLRQGSCWSPVLLLTARDAVGDRVRGLDAGADDYLVKPFAFAELAARLRALLRRGSPERPSMITLGDLTLDPAARTVQRAGQHVDLTAKEFALLELLMRNPGLVLSRTRILEHVWDIAYDANSNVVDQYVAYLRRKIDKPFGRDDLQTVRGVGYRLRVEVPAPDAPPSVVAADTR